MINLDELFGKAYNYMWLTAIIGSVIVLIESILNIGKILDAGIGIGISIIVITCAILSRKDVNGTGFAILICSYFLILSPIGFSGFYIGSWLILIGGLISTSGGFFTYTSFFIYVAIGALIVDLISFFILY